MIRAFQIASFVLAVIAGWFLWSGNMDGAFISAVLGSVSYFLSVRWQVKDRLRAREAEEASDKNQIEIH